jgi:hypothetical protein
MMIAGKDSNDPHALIPLRAKFDQPSGARWFEWIHELSPEAAGYPRQEDLRDEVYAFVKSRLAEMVPMELVEKKAKYDQMVSDIELRFIDLQDNLRDLFEKRQGAFLEASANRLADIDAQIVATRGLMENCDANLDEAKRLSASVETAIEEKLAPLIPGIVAEFTALPASVQKVVDDLREFFARHESELLEVNRLQAASWLFSPNRQGSWFSALRSFATNAAKEAVAQIPVEA